MFVLNTIIIVNSEASTVIIEVNVKEGKKADFNTIIIRPTIFC